MSCRAVGTGGAQGHVPPQYLEQPVVVPLQYFQQIWGLTKWVPPQYLAPSYGPDTARRVEAELHICGATASMYLLSGYSLDSNIFLKR